MRVKWIYIKKSRNKTFFNNNSENYDFRHKELGLIDNKLKITEYLNEDIKYILEEIGFKNITFIEINSKTYKLLVCNK